MKQSQIVFGFIAGIAILASFLGLIDYPHWADVIIISLLAVWLFTAGIHAKQMMEKEQIDSFLTWCYSPMIIVVILLDVMFNVFWGSIIFREPPREFLFTTRVKRHIERRNGFRKDAADTWARRLNYIDPGHV